MSFLNSPELKVGAMVVIVSGLIGVMSLKVAEGPGLFSGSKKYSFLIDNAGGLVKNSAVKMAGIKVGVIDDIQLEKSKAKITLLLDKKTPMSSSTKIELRTDGILGDRHVELVPGNMNDPELPSGSQIFSTAESGGLDDVMKQVNKIAKNLTQLSETLNRATKDSGDESTPIGRIVLNIEKVSRDLAHISGQNKEKINEIVEQVRNLTAKLDKYVSSDSLTHLQATLKNVDDITSKINKGEGTIGKLVNDEQTIDEINSAVTNVNQMLGGFSRWETSVDFHSEFLAQGDAVKSYLALRLQPGLDRYYELQVVDDPRGYVEEVDTSTAANSGPTTTIKTVTTYRDKLKFTALFAKNFYDLTVKGGLIESTGGFGVDYYLLNRDLRFSVEFFNFSQLDVRAFARYNIFKGIYATSGIDNALNQQGLFSVFVGAGLFLTNDDIKTLATRLSL